MVGKPPPDMTGERFDKLIVIGRNKKIISRRAYWDCVCDCGVRTVVLGSNLRNGRSGSCGCRHKDIMSKMKSKHRHHKSGTYCSWENMIQRCTNPNSPNYYNYGARGITVCDKWKVFENFLFDMGERPLGRLHQYSIDRIRNELGYQPGNCRWATNKIQMRNKRTNVFTEEKVQEVLNMYSSGIKQIAIAKKFNVHPSLIGGIVNRKIWS